MSDYLERKFDYAMSVWCGRVWKGGVLLGPERKRSDWRGSKTELLSTHLFLRRQLCFCVLFVVVPRGNG